MPDLPMLLRRRLVPTAIAALLASATFALAEGDSKHATPAELAQRLADVQADPPKTRAMLKTGRGIATICANCHGEGGNSSRPEVPNLAGQNPAYLLDQIRQFSQGLRRNEFMEGMIKAMNADEQISIVVFYASQAVDTRPADDSELARKGQSIYSRNCFRCHGDDGHGNAQLARIAGQQKVYLRQTLDRYRKAVGGRVNPLMTANTQLLRDEDIEALVAYVSTMP